MYLAEDVDLIINALLWMEKEALIFKKTTQFYLTEHLLCAKHSPCYGGCSKRGKKSNKNVEGIKAKNDVPTCHNRTV